MLFVDIDGVISLWGSESNTRPAGALHNLDGVMHSFRPTLETTCSAFLTAWDSSVQRLGGEGR